MVVSELRKDYVIDRWVVIASQRRKRPLDFIERRHEERRNITCPFCPGNEHLTPPASLVYVIGSDSEVRREKDRDGERHKNWIVRCFPNLYPAFTPEESTATLEQQGGPKYVRLKALGHHEVLVESPNHDEHPGVARLSQLVHVINALRDRVSFFIAKDYVRYVSIFRNHGASAGASLSHTHMQIIAMPIPPKLVSEELITSERYYRDNGRCIFCDIISEERKTDRLIYEDNNFVVFAPWASINPFEFWLFPKRHQSSILDLTDDEIRSFAKTLRLSLGGLRNLLNDPPYNLGFHMTPVEYYHWHIEVYPALSIWAGFEKSNGIYINIVPPEEAAKYLKESLNSERDKTTYNISSGLI
ncbi:MAG: DUF4921 family protein [Candidatus Bathyarchaeia archaeon]